MRTLKKTLALVLCLAMIAGLCCFGTSAAFADAAEIEKTEAVEVMNMIGVLKGDGTNFNPKGILTRAEAAVMLAKLVGAGDVKSTSTFKDMAGYEWAQQYAAVCEDKGFILGDGNGNFLPGQTLTGYQFGLMLARALGYKPASEGVQAATYEIGTAALMKKIGLTAAIVGFDGTAGLTRENAAALLLQAMKSTMVEYKDAGTTITGGGFTITTGATANSKVENTTSSYLASDYTAGVLQATCDDVMQLCEMYFPTLQLVDGDTDDAYGRPAANWTYTNPVTKVPASVAAPAAPVMTSTGVITAAELYNTLGYKAKLDVSASSYTVSDRTRTGAYWFVTGSTRSDYVVADKNANLGKPGIVTEIYKLDDVSTTDYVEYAVVQIRPTLAKVGTPVKTPATAVEGAYTTYSVAGISLKEYTSVVNGTERNNFVSDKALAKDDYVLIYGNATVGYTVKAATLVEGAVTGYTSATNAWTIGGTSYPVSGAEIYSSCADGRIAATAAVKTYAVDTYGNVIGSVDVTIPEYVYVVAADTADYLNATTNKVETVVEATVFTTAGELKTLQVQATDATDLDATTRGAQTTGLYTYTINALTGKYVLTEASSAANAVTGITNKVATLASGLYANDATVYYVGEYNLGLSKWTGITKYTGYTNAPTLNLEGVLVTALDVNADAIADMVFVSKGVAVGATTTYIYFTGDYTSDAIGAKTYSSITKDVAGSIKVTSGVSTAGLYTMRAGVASGVSATQALTIGTQDGIYANKYYTYNNGALMTCSTQTGTYTYLAPIAGTVPVYTYQFGAVTTSTAADLDATTGSLVVFALNAAKTAVECVYIVK